MTAKQLQDLIDSNDMSQSDLARKLGLEPRTIRRYVAGEYPVPRPVALATLYLFGVLWSRAHKYVEGL